MPPHYLQKPHDKRAVVLLDDHYSYAHEPEDSFLRAVVEQLRQKDLLVYAHDTFSTVGNLIAHHRGAWDRPTPAPSVWILDVEVALGRHLRQNIADGVALARHIRLQDIQRPDRFNQWAPIPIVFLTRFASNDTVPNGLDPTSNQPLQQRIRNDVQVGWWFFRKNWDDPANLAVDEELPNGQLRRCSLDEFAAFVANLAG
jgi:hypothetical protein